MTWYLRTTEPGRPRPPTPVVSPSRSPALPSGRSEVLRRAISEIDDYLSVRGGVHPYDVDDECLFRLAVVPSLASVTLVDGCAVALGDTIAELHLWNEHIPCVAEDGPNLAWAREVAHRIARSLGLLARVLATEPALQDVKACRARTSFVGLNGSGQSLSRLIGRFGFEAVDEGDQTLTSRIHDAFENVLIGALVWTHNPQTLRRDKFIRQRRSVWISRERLVALHGRSGQA